MPTPPTPEQIALARQLYIDGEKISVILARTGMSLGTLYYWLDGGPVENGVPRLPPIPRRRSVLGKRRRPLKGSRVSLVKRIWRTAERQVRDIEARVARNLQDPGERERDARVLAVLARTLRELAAFDVDKDNNGGADKTADDDDVPQDMDELRRALACRLEALNAGDAAAVDRGDAAG
jgi:hypothetical protein